MYKAISSIVQPQHVDMTIHTTMGTMIKSAGGCSKPRHPDGKPNVTAANDRIETDVDTAPAESVTTTVTIDGAGVIKGKAEILVNDVFCPNIAL